jgi:hypothetical protein
VGEFEQRRQAEEKGFEEEEERDGNDEPLGKNRELFNGNCCFPESNLAREGSTLLRSLKAQSSRHRRSQVWKIPVKAKKPRWEIHRRVADPVEEQLMKFNLGH